MEYKIDNLLNKGHSMTTEIQTKEIIKGVWVYARPIGFQGWYKWVIRFKEALLVLIGKADILTWYKQ